MKLVGNWKDWYKWYSTWLAAASAGLQAAVVGYVALPAEAKALLPGDLAGYMQVSAVILAVLVPVGRVLQQGCEPEQLERDNDPDDWGV
jgi:hypothetical protein